MNRLLCLLLLCCASGRVPANEEARSRASERQIRVLLEKNNAQSDLLAPLGHLQWRTEENAIWHALPAVVKVTWHAERSQFQVGQTSVSASTLFFRAGEKGNEPWVLNGKRRRGILQVSRLRYQTAYVLRVPLELYTEGVVIAEMGSRAEFEALKAQAVAARTFALYRFQRPRHGAYDVDATIADQVFDDSVSHSLVADAVKDTRGQYLTYDDKSPPIPFKAFYHSRCGGQTASAKEVWLNPEGNKSVSVPCAYCQRNHYRWRAQVSVEELTSVLKMPLAPVRLAISKATANGRLLELVAKGTGPQVTLRAEELRQKLGFTRLQGTQFTWDVENSNFTFTGRGAGHGVGLCQWGARGMARAGSTYEEILSHYYAGSRLHRPEMVVARKP